MSTGKSRVGRRPGVPGADQETIMSAVRALVIDRRSVREVAAGIPFTEQTVRRWQREYGPGILEAEGIQTVQAPAPRGRVARALTASAQSPIGRGDELQALQDEITRLKRREELLMELAQLRA